MGKKENMFTGSILKKTVREFRKTSRECELSHRMLFLLYWLNIAFIMDAGAH